MFKYSFRIDISLYLGFLYIALNNPTHIEKGVLRILSVNLLEDRDYVCATNTEVVSRSTYRYLKDFKVNIKKVLGSV